MSRRSIGNYRFAFAVISISGVILAGCSNDVSAPSEASVADSPALQAKAGGKAEAKPKVVELTDQVLAESHRQMIGKLAEVAREATKTNVYFNGQSRAEPYRAKLKRAIEQGDVVGQLENHRSIGTFEMNVGNSATAAEHLKKACDLISEVESRRLAYIPPESKESLYLKCAVAHLRLAEDENCVHCADGAACILPIQERGVHQNRRGAEGAMKYFRLVCEVNPRNAIAVWLWNVAAMTLGEHPGALPEEYRISPDRFVSDQEFPAFANVAADVGLDTLSHAGGAIADDFDGDDWIDLIVSSWAPDGQLQFFRNGGDGTFTNMTESANLIGITGGLNIVHADYDNDGDLDVFVLRGAWLTPDIGSYPNSLLQNDGQGRFTDVTFAVGLAGSDHPTQTAAWADYDNDGDLDLYIGNEKTRCQLFQNDQGRFIDVAQQAGVANRLGYAKAVSWGDFDGDRWPDLYVSNLGQDNLLFHNQRDGTFREVAGELNVTEPKDSFASWFWDYNNDGNLDLFVGSYSVGVQFVSMDYLGVGRITEPDRLYEGIGKGNFKEVGQAKGLVAVTQPMGCNFGDLDNDGFLDFYLGTGYPGYDGLMPNVMYRNRQGLGFDDVTFAGRFGHLQKGHGVAFVDLDHDGDQDVFTEMGGAFEGDAFHDALFENPGFSNHWLKVRLIGSQSNRCAIGARIKLTFEEDGKPRTVYRWVSSGSSFGGNPFRQEIGLGQAVKVSRLEVDWPTTNQQQVFEDLDADQFIEITEGDSELRVIDCRAVKFDAE